MHYLSGNLIIISFLLSLKNSLPLHLPFFRGIGKRIPICFLLIGIATG